MICHEAPHQRHLDVLLRGPPSVNILTLAILRFSSAGRFRRRYSDSSEVLLVRAKGPTSGISAASPCLIAASNQAVVNLDIEEFPSAVLSESRHATPSWGVAARSGDDHHHRNPAGSRMGLVRAARCHPRAHRRRGAGPVRPAPGGCRGPPVNGGANDDPRQLAALRGAARHRRQGAGLAQGADVNMALMRRLAEGAATAGDLRSAAEAVRVCMAEAETLYQQAMTEREQALALARQAA